MAISKWYGNAIKEICSKQVDWITDDIKVMLCTSTYVPNQDSHSVKTDVTNEIAGTGYTAGGESLATKTNTYDGATNKLTLDADDVQWTTATFTYRFAVIYDSTSLKLLGYVDFESDQSVVNGTATIQWDAAGIFQITVA